MEYKNSVHPTKEQMEGFLEGDSEAPIAMINLLKFREKAQYEDGRDTDLTGEQAYAIYMDEVVGHLKKVGGEDLVSALQEKIDVDVIIATPDMMAVVSKIAKVLGPKGLMPNPKTGTVTNDVKSTIDNINKGLVAYKNDKAGTIHAALGKSSFDENHLSENINSFVEEIKKIKPSGVKGNFINSVFISSTMGFGLKVEV